MAKQFEINPLDGEQMGAMLDHLIKYRTDLNIDTQWESCIIKDRAYGANDVVGSDNSVIKRTISLPIIRKNNTRKVAAIGSVRVKPVIYSETYGGDNFSEVRSSVMRWGIRVSSLMDAAVFTSRPMVMLGQGVAQLVWDPNALDGQGAPLFDVKDTRNIFIDGRRRQWDINRECRIIAEKQRYTRAECEEYWPDYFSNYAGKLLSDTKAINAAPDEVIGSTSPEEGGEIDLLFVEYAAQAKTGWKIVKAGIFDASQNKWVQEPRDNGLGMFSYIINGLQPEMGLAYPLAPNLAEHELVALTNLAYTLFIHSAFKNADGPLFYDPENSELVEYLKKHKTFALGAVVPSRDGKAPEQLKMTGQEEFLRAAQTLHGISNDASEVQDTMRGDASPGTSGRLFAMQNASAELNMEPLRDAVKRFFVQGCTAMDRMLRVKVDGYRTLISRDGQQTTRTQVNILFGTSEYEEMKSKMEAGEAKGYETARMYKGKGKDKMYVGSAEIAKAESLLNTMKIDSFEKFINDITVGGLEVDVEIEPITSRAERKQQAQLARQTESIDLLTYLSELGYENPQVIVERLKAENQAMQIGSMVMESPELMKAIEILPQDPLLMRLVTDPRASATLKMQLASKAAARQNQAPQDGA